MNANCSLCGDQTEKVHYLTGSAHITGLFGKTVVDVLLIVFIRIFKRKKINDLFCFFRKQ